MKVNITYDNSDDKPWQNVDIQLDDQDTYNADETLAYIIIPVLKQLQKTTYSFPNDLYEKYGDAGFKKWQEAIGKMIKAFELVVEDDNYLYEKARSPKVLIKLLEQREEKIQHGLNLFAKYYRNLWD